MDSETKKKYQVVIQHRINLCHDVEAWNESHAKELALELYESFAEYGELTLTPKTRNKRQRKRFAEQVYQYEPDSFEIINVTGQVDTSAVGMAGKAVA